MVETEEPKTTLIGGNGVRNLSTCVVHTTRGTVPILAVQSWFELIYPLNHRYKTFFVSGLEPANGYNEVVERILTEHPDYPYILFHEDDNLAPKNALIKLQNTIGDYDGIGGYYVTKDEMHWPILLGNPRDITDFTPQFDASGVRECNAMGTGFVLFKSDMFRRLPKPWFRSVDEPEPGYYAMQYDCYFYYNARRHGCRFAVNCSVSIGHLDTETNEVFYPITKPDNGKGESQ